MKKIIAVCLLLGLMGCATTATIQPRQSKFVENDFYDYLGPGDGRIIGQAFLKTQGGDVKYGAGNEVMLVPVTPYTKETMDRRIWSEIGFMGIDRRLQKYIRRTVADGQGGFEFDGIPSGDYFLICTIVWGVPSRYMA